MHKKLKKYIESYLTINYSLQDENIVEFMPNGGMIILSNIGKPFDLKINEKSYTVNNMQTVLINASENSVFINYEEEVHIIGIRFKGAGASFFLNEPLDELEDIVLLNEDIHLLDDKSKLDFYFLDKFRPSKLPFNILRIISLVETKNGEYNIDEILASANVPRRTFDKIFQRQVGLSLKTFANIIKEINII